MIELENIILPAATVLKQMSYDEQTATSSKYQFQLIRKGNLSIVYNFLTSIHVITIRRLNGAFNFL